MPLTDDDKKTIRGTVVRWGVLGVLAGVSTGALATYGYLRNATADIFDPMPTKNVVIASLVPCNEFGNGWNQFQEASGRFIIGAGDHTSDVVSEYNVFGDSSPDPKKKPATDGVETVALTIEQIPEHQHFEFLREGNPELRGKTVSFGIFRSPDNLGHFEAPAANLGKDAEGRARSGNFAPAKERTQGKNGEHSNMPPYIALYFCKKG